MNRRLLTVCAAILIGACSVPSADTAPKAPPAEADRPAPPAGGVGGGGPNSWPMFGGTPSRNMVNLVEKGLPTDWSTLKGKHRNVRWSAEPGSIAYGAPVVSGGKVFVGTNNERPRNPKVKGDKGVLMCFDEATGNFLWQAVHDKLPNPGENDHEKVGIASSPAVEGDRLYYVSNRCELVCADAEGFLDGENDGVQDEKSKDKTDADVVWRLDMIGELDVYPHYLANCSPVVFGDLVFVVTGNGVEQEEHKVVSPKAPSFLAVEKATGKVAWKDASPGEKIMAGQWANPACGTVKGKDLAVFPGGDGVVYAFEAKTGKPAWKFDCNPAGSEYKVSGRGRRNYIMATPVIHDDKVYVGTGCIPDDGVDIADLWCIDATKSGDLSPQWEKDPDAVEEGGLRPKAGTGGYVWHYGGAPPAGSKRDFAFGRTMSTCAVHDGLVYAAELDGFVHCLDAKTGKKYWEHDVKAAFWASPVVADGKVYIGDEQGFYHVLTHGKEKKPIAKIEMDAGTTAPPVFANGVLFVLNEKKLYAIAGK
jgi:outer membrane protein assembly factor BamB